MQHHAADQLDVEVAHAERAPAGLAAEREGLVEQVVERLAVAGALAQLVGLLAQLVVLEQLHLGLDGVDALDALLVVLELARLAHAQGAVYEFAGHGRKASSGLPRRPAGRRGRLLRRDSGGGERVPDARACPGGHGACRGGA